MLIILSYRKDHYAQDSTLKPAVHRRASIRYSIWQARYWTPCWWKVVFTLILLRIQGIKVCFHQRMVSKGILQSFEGILMIILAVVSRGQAAAQAGPSREPSVGARPEVSKSRGPSKPGQSRGFRAGPGLHITSHAFTGEYY